MTPRPSVPWPPRCCAWHRSKHTSAYEQASRCMVLYKPIRNSGSTLVGYPESSIGDTVRDGSNRAENELTTARIETASAETAFTEFGGVNIPVGLTPTRSWTAAPHLTRNARLAGVISTLRLHSSARSTAVLRGGRSSWTVFQTVANSMRSYAVSGFPRVAEVRDGEQTSSWICRELLAIDPEQRSEAVTSAAPHLFIRGGAPTWDRSSPRILPADIPPEPPPTAAMPRLPPW